MNEIPFAVTRPEDIGIYEAGDDRIEGQSDAVKLSSNENPFGAGTLARTALAQSLNSIERYPSQDHAELRAAIADVHGLDPDRIVCGAGSDEVLGMLCKGFAGWGSEVIHTRHGFLMYPIFARSVGAEPVEVDETDRRVDVGKILERVSKKTRLVFIANPNNPTGTMIGHSEIARLADGLPEGALLVIDSAYAEYADDYDGGASLAESRRNIVMTRTFSKIHGLASLRVGYGYGPRPVIDLLNRIRGPFNVGGPAQAAATAALRDDVHIRRSLDHNSSMRRFLASRLAEAGVPSDESHANFILARFASAGEAADCDASLRAAGIIVRRTDAYKLPHCLRITIGDTKSCEAVCSVVAEFKKQRVDCR